MQPTLLFALLKRLMFAVEAAPKQLRRDRTALPNRPEQLERKIISLFRRCGLGTTIKVIRWTQARASTC
jgi:hypothetical protein